MSSSRCRRFFSLRKYLISLKPEAVISSGFKDASLGGIWSEPIADIPDLMT